MRFEWDEAKNRANQDKHRVSFETASEIFDDPLHASRPDRIIDGEQRWPTIGTVGGVVLLLWSHTHIRMTAMKKSYASYRRAARPGQSAEPTSAVRKRSTELRKLAKLSEDKIDTSDIPETTDWSTAVVGKFYRPIKQQVTIRVDADVLAWFKAQGGKYQTAVNQALREHMARKSKDRG